MQTLRTHVPLENLPLLRLVAGLLVNQDVVDAALPVAEAEAARPAPHALIGRRRRKGVGTDKERRNRNTNHGVKDKSLCQTLDGHLSKVG